MSREPYTHQRALPCPNASCQSDNLRLVSVIQGGEVRVTLQCRCCGHLVHQIGTEFFRTAADAFATWNRQVRAAA